MKKILLIITMLVLGIGSSNGQDYSIYEYVLANANSSTTTYYVSYFSSGDHDYGATSNIDNASEFKFEKTGTEGEYYWKDITNNKYIYAISKGWLAAADSKQDNDAYKWYIIAGENGLTITDKVNYNNGSPTKGLIGISSGYSSPGGYLATACTLSANTSSRYWNLLLKPNKANNLSTGWYQIKYQDLGSASGDNIVSNVIQKYVMNHDNEVTVGDNKYSLYLGDKTFSDKDELAKSFVYFSQASKHDSYGSTGTLRGANGHFVAYTGIASTTPSNVCPIWVTNTDPTHITITSGYSSSTTRQTLVPKEDNGTKYLGAVTNKYPGTYWSPITLADYDMVAWSVTVTNDPANIKVTYTGSDNYGIDNVYNGGTFFFKTGVTPTAAEFTVPKYACHTSEVTVDEGNKTITVTYTLDDDIPSDYNAYIGETTVDETKWKTQSNWNLASGASWNNYSPGYSVPDGVAGMWQPIYLKGVTATGIQLEGWAFSADLINSSLTATTKKIQSDWTINVAEDSELILTMTSSDSHPDDGTHTFNINGSMTINARPNRFNGINVSDNRVNIGENGHFELISSSNLSINNSASFTINVTPTEPTNYNEVLSQETPFAVIQNVTFADGKLTFGTTETGITWERVNSYADLSQQTDAGEHFYYFIEEAEYATGEKKYKLYTYKQKIYSRNVTSGNFGSICIPNAVEEMDGIEKVLAVTEVGTDRVVMDVVNVDKMVAGVPYIFKSNDNTINLTLKGETVASPNNDTQSWLVGNFEPTTETPVYYVPMSDDNNSYYVLQSNQFKKVTSANSIKSGSNRCYLKVPATSQSRLSTLGISVDEDGATGIDALNALINNNAEIYDINGRKLKDLRKGINIVNGVKVLVK